MLLLEFGKARNLWERISGIDVYSKHKTIQMTSEMLDDKGDKFKYTFTGTGEFQYYCQPHRIMGMRGMFTVRK